MSRSLDTNLIANQILDTARGCDNIVEPARRDAIRIQFERLTMGLAEYERHRIVWLVNFRLAAPVL